MIGLFVALTLGLCPPCQEQPVPPVPSLFAEWLQQFRLDAEAAGISAATLDRALTGLEPHPLVVQRDRTQRELILSVRDYVNLRVTKGTIRTARREHRRHAALLRRVQRKYGVPSEVVVAVWGLESNFGRFSGVRPTIQALATLAWEGRRAQLFRSELIAALGILDRGDVDFARLKGSWAGAMGQVQFLPSSYVRFAQDFDGNARKDIWGSLPDVFASIANYLRESGWTPGQRWGVAVKAPASPPPALLSLLPQRATGCSAVRELTMAARVGDWSKAGLRLTNRLPQGAAASFLTLGHATFLVTKSYEAILAYNCAHSYAMSVAELADAIRPAPASPSRRRRPRR